jgi:L-rhamnose mutarotase
MSPYENRLRSESFRRVGLISTVLPGKLSELSAATTSPDKNTRDRWAGLGLANVSIHLQGTTDTTFIFLFTEFTGSDSQVAAELVQQDPFFATLADLLQAHPRAAVDSVWLPMELINIIGPTLPEPTNGRPIERSGLMAGLEPASELQYRTLHQTNWPGVVDQMARSNRRYWVTFLIDFGEQLWLFTYSEYVGDDYAADDAATAADPVTQRWWKFTEPCLIPLTPGGENWTTMQALMR